MLGLDNAVNIVERGAAEISPGGRPAHVFVRTKYVYMTRPHHACGRAPQERDWVLQEDLINHL